MKSWLRPFKASIRRFLNARAGNLAMVSSMVFICCLVTYLTFFTDPGRRLDLWVRHIFFNQRGSLEAPKDIVIAAIDDETYKQLGASPRWPFPRIHTAESIQKISDAGARLIILDLNFPIENQDPIANDKLEFALKSGPVATFAGKIAVGGTKDVERDPDNNIKETQADPRFLKAAKMLLPMWVLSDLNMVNDISISKNPNAPVENRVPFVKALREIAKIEVLVPEPWDLINYYGPKGAIDRVPLYKIVQGEPDYLKEKFNNKVVFVGYQSIERGRGQIDKDEFQVPISKDQEDYMFGVEIHANIAGNLIENSWLRRFSPVDELLMVILSSLIISFIILFSGFKMALAIVGMLIAGAIILCYQAFAHYYTWLPIVGPVGASCLLALAANQTLRYLKTERKNKLNEKFWDFETEE